MTDGAAGIEALAGWLRLKIVGGDARFGVFSGNEEAGLLTCEIRPPGATIGRGQDADHRLKGPSTEGLSRRHLLLQPAGRQWIVLDCSKNGTWEAVETDGKRDWRRLPRDLPIPAVADMRLALGTGLELKVEVVRTPSEGGTTATDDGAPPLLAERIPTDELEQIARALLAPRGSGTVTIPPIGELTRRFHMSRATLNRRVEALGDLPQVKPLLDGKPRTEQGRRRSQDVADALAIAFPYLTASGHLG